MGAQSPRPSSEASILTLTIYKEEAASKAAAKAAAKKDYNTTGNADKEKDKEKDEEQDKQEGELSKSDCGDDDNKNNKGDAIKYSY